MDKVPKAPENRAVKKVLLISLIFWVSLANAGEEKVLTLGEAYHQALTQSETLAIQEQTIRIAEAHYTEALGTVLPHLDVNASELIQDTTTLSSGSGTSVTGTLTSRSRPEIAVTVTQPLFQGLREFHALKVSNAEKTQNRLTTERARQLLFSDVAKAYYTILEVEAELRIQRSILGALQKRKEELTGRIKLGRSRKSDLFNTESDTAQAEADVENTKGLVNTARDYLGFLTGHPVTEKIKDDFPIPSPLPPLKNFQAAAANRSDVGAAKASAQLAKGEVNYAKGALLPSLGLTSNYYPYRTGYQKDIKWDVTFGFTVPIFEGGTLRGPVKEAQAQFKQAELVQQQVSRQAQLELIQAYHALTASYSQAKALRTAETKSRSGYEALSKEYGLSLVNNLDVLEGLKEWHDKSVKANQSFFQTKLYYLQLLTASGQIPAAQRPTAQGPEVTP